MELVRDGRQVDRRAPRGTIFLAMVMIVALAPAFQPGVSAAIGEKRVFEGPVGEAECGPGSKPEPRLQGQVSRADRDSGRSQKGYRCNLELVGQYQGEGTSWQVAWYEDCAYYDTKFPNTAESPGVQVLDVSNPRRPKLTTNLTTPAMLGPWESLKVNEKRGLLAGVAAWGPIGNGPLFFDVYDVTDDCAHPKLLNSTPLPITVPSNPQGHEGDWAPDGKTYYGSSTYTGSYFAIDVTDPTMPRFITGFKPACISHGLGVSADGNRLYATSIGGLVGRDSCPDAGPNSPLGSAANGMRIVDVSAIQSRATVPTTSIIGSVYWDDGALAQHAIPITIKGHPYALFVDEGGAGAARIIDIADETKPRIVSKLKLEIHMPEHEGQRAADTADEGFFGYEAHYCGVDRLVDTRAVACGYFQSGIRVFDVRNPMKPKEIAYFNPPAQVGKNDELEGSEHAAGGAGLTADWCSAQVRFHKRQLWTTCQDNGFLVLRFTNGVWPR